MILLNISYFIILYHVHLNVVCVAANPEEDSNFRNMQRIYLYFLV